MATLPRVLVVFPLNVSHILAITVTVSAAQRIAALQDNAMAPSIFSDMIALTGTLYFLDLEPSS